MSCAVFFCTRLRAPARALYFILPKHNKITFEGQQQSLCVPCQLQYRGIKADDGLRDILPARRALAQRKSAKQLTPSTWLGVYRDMLKLHVTKRQDDLPR